MNKIMSINNFIIICIIMSVFGMSYWILHDAVTLSNSELWSRYLVLVIIIFSIFYLYKKVILDDIHKLTKAVENKEIDTNKYHSDEMELIKKIFNRYNKDIEEAKEKLKNLSYEDQLTGAFNQNFFNIILTENINNFNRYHTKFSLLIFEIDNIEKLNKKHSSQEIDKVLTELTKLIEQKVRSTDILCKLDNNEFAILLINTGLINSYKHVALKLNDFFADHVFSNGIKVTLSQGVTVVKKGDLHNTILARAREYAKYSKTLGKNHSTYDLSYKKVFKRTDRD